jgi:prepilin signal peptidase PulO-like enzyme (type II secretory pathway)
MLIIFFIFGLIIGSFLNAVIYRTYIAENLFGRSFCPHCKKQIRWYDNIPLLSFVFLRGECRDCKKKISWQYPLLELSMGIAFALIGNYFFFLFEPLSWLQTGFYLAVFSLLAVIFVYDFLYMEIPMIIFWITLGVSIAYLLIFDWLNFNSFMGIFSLQIFSGMLAGAIAFTLFFILVSVSKEKWMGMGDAYLAFLAGLIVGWPFVIFSLVLAFGIGAIFGLVLISTKKKTMKSQIPFAPFLILGIFITLILPQIFPMIRYFLPFYF